MEPYPTRGPTHSHPLPPAHNCIPLQLFIYHRSYMQSQQTCQEEALKRWEQLQRHMPSNTYGESLADPITVLFEGKRFRWNYRLWSASRLEQDVFFEWFAECTLPNLKKIKIDCFEVSAENIENVARAKLPLLEELDLQSLSLDSKTLESLKIAKWSCLKKLNLANNCIKLQGINQLLKANFRSLKTLNLKSNGLNGKACLQIVKLEVPELSKLVLDSNQIKKVGSVAIFTKSNWNALTSLSMVSCRVGQALCCIHESKWPLLTNLNLRNNGFSGHKGLKSLVTAKFPRLKRLVLDYNPLIEVRGWKFMQHSCWPELQMLSLTGSGICDESLPFLLVKQWPQLRILYLGAGYSSSAKTITTNGVRILHKYSNWPKLTHFQMDNWTQKQSTPEAIRLLSEIHWPDLQKLKINITSKRWHRKVGAQMEPQIRRLLRSGWTGSWDFMFNDGIDKFKDI